MLFYLKRNRILYFQKENTHKLPSTTIKASIKWMWGGILYTNLHHREESIQQADSQREGVRWETKEPGQRQQVLHLQFPESGGHPEAVVLGGLYKPQATKLRLIPGLQIHQGLHLNSKGLCSRFCHRVNHLCRCRQGKKNSIYTRYPVERCNARGVKLNQYSLNLLNPTPRWGRRSNKGQLTCHS